MSFDDENDKKLANFLKQNQPITPSAKPDEAKNILASIESDKPKTEELKIRSWWIAASVVAASFLLGVMIFTSSIKEQNGDDLVELQAMIDESLQENGDFVGAGEDWMSLLEEEI